MVVAKLDKQPVGAGWEFLFSRLSMHTQQVTIEVVVIHSSEEG